ncbi:butyryl-CoA dehydrogenase [Deferribacter desulfuricans SSM1]|uniref:Cyclohex-1-ene-1-carbonyl-CoA dehydrogenase n=1 Tax=Deferribacter desulfuricans (strain DSM 14783 / JCM 11476 / NBRC 101012 / SSM1) TaxID=639282 RepID=D3P999_DEFDS|nr:acyl-CoA dehydrogenase [Deferribacter desulfuricans]BAI81289.1 butyryl-CoA dehydrogenase [Deferribacter desulfuricans SSM1]
MNFELTQDHKVLQDTLRDFVKNEIAPIAADIDKNHEIPADLVKKIGEMGFLGTYIPEEYGGAGLDYFSYIMTVEEVSKACASTGVMISAHTSLAADPILQFGNEEQKKKYLPPLATGERIGCIMLTEPEAGSDVANISTTYRDEGDHYVVNGSKIFITNGAFRGISVLFATKDKNLKHKGLSAFILDLESEGVEILKNEEKLGIRGSYTTAFALDNVKIPKENLLGNEGDGFKIAMETLNGGRIGIAAQALGIAEGAFEKCLSYVQERKQFGKPLAAFQAIQFKLADMATRIEASKLITYKAAWLKDMKKTNAIESAMAKMYASETATFVTKEAVQIHGGYGYICEYEVERMFRDAKITEIYEGTNEVQRIVISKMLLK